MSQSRDDWNVVRMLEWATSYFEQKNVPSPRLSIEWLLSFVLDLPRLHLYMQFDRPLTTAELEQLRPLLLRRARHEPLQYITGHTDFYTCTFEVSPAVLIPRPETEELVDLILKEHPKSESSKHLIDLGTGSGCIAISLKKERPSWSVSGIDTSEEALLIARSNARKNNTDVVFEKADFTQQWPGDSNKFDIIVSNPPYVLETEREQLALQVREYEPSLALFTPSLSSIYAPIIAQSAKRLVPDGKLYLEIHENHAAEICSYFPKDIWEISILKDMGGKERFIKGRILAIK